MYHIDKIFSILIYSFFRMPKLKKRRNVSSQRKRRYAPQPKPLSDHTYCSFDEKSEAIVASCLQEEIEICNLRLDVCNESIDPINTGEYEYFAVPVEESDLNARRHEPIEVDECLEPIIECTEHHVIDVFEELKMKVKQNVCSPYTCSPNTDNIQIVELYPSTDKVSVKLNVTINKNFAAKVYVHRIELDADHDFWIGLPTTFHNFTNIQMLLLKLSSYTVCTGNFEADLIDSFPVGSTIETAADVSPCQGFHEGDFGATKGSFAYNSTVRNIKCSLLVQGKRCSP